MNPTNEELKKGCGTQLLVFVCGQKDKRRIIEYCDECYFRLRGRLDVYEEWHSDANAVPCDCLVINEDCYLKEKIVELRGVLGLQDNKEVNNGK